MTWGQEVAVTVGRVRVDPNDSTFHSRLSQADPELPVVPPVIYVMFYLPYEYSEPHITPLRG